MLLSGAGYVVHEARDGKEALALALANTLDLILIDLRMPLLSGYDVIMKVRRAGVCARILVITADVFPPAKEQALAAGADAYASKPISHRDLLARCEILLTQAVTPQARAG